MAQKIYNMYGTYTQLIQGCFVIWTDSNFKILYKYSPEVHKIGFYVRFIIDNHKNRSKTIFTHKDQLIINGIYYNLQQYNINGISTQSLPVNVAWSTNIYSGAL